MKTMITLKALFRNMPFLFVIFSLPLTAQPKLQQQAREMKMNYDYVKAVSLYTDYFLTAQPTLQDKRDIAECYMMMGNTVKAEEWLSKVIKTQGHQAEDVLHYALVLKSNGKYQDAIRQFTAYALLIPTDTRVADSQIQSCLDAIEWMNDPVYFDISNVAEMNSENSEFGLQPFAEGYLLTTDRRLTGKNYGQDDIYGWTGNPYLKLMYYNENVKNAKHDKVQEVNELNNNYHNGPGFYDENTSIMYYTRTKMVKLRKKPFNSDPTSWYDHSGAREYTNRLEIYFASYNNGKWDQPQAFEYNNPEEYSVGHPVVSPDGNILYFVSDMEGGYGASDIYFCEKMDNGKWSSPVNAGSSVNTPGKEVFPYISNDGVLYFSSDGHNGMGGLDLFSAKGNRNHWSAPENLKYPFNSPKDDFSLTYSEDGLSGFFASNRDGGKGLDDIYSFVPAPPKTLIMSVLVKEQMDNNDVIIKNAKVKIVNIADNQIDYPISDDEGIFYMKADCNTEYDVIAGKEGYFSSSEKVKTECITRNDTLFVELKLEKIVINKPIVLENIYYDFDKWNIRPDAATELDKLVKILLDNPGINIELGSHTDSRGSDAYNLNLSQKRAESAVTYIISKGIDPLRITAKGYGESIPVNHCVNGVKCSDEEFQLNRRTEFKVTSISTNQAGNL